MLQTIEIIMLPGKDKTTNTSTCKQWFIQDNLSVESFVLIEELTHCGSIPIIQIDRQYISTLLVQHIYTISHALCS